MAMIEARHRGLYASLFTVYLLVGTSMTIIGASLPKLLADFSWDYSTAGAVIAASSAAFAAASLASGFFLRRLGPKATIACGAALITVGLALFAISPSPALNFALNILIGAGQGLLEPTVNWSVLRMNKTGGSGRSMTLMHGSFAVGAVVGPVIVGALLSVGISWTLVYRCIALLFAVLALICMALPFRLLGSDAAESPAEAAASPGKASIARSPLLWIGAAAFLFYVGTELGISTWIAEYFVSTFKSNPARASFMVSLFWIGILAGRLGAPIVYKGSRQGRLLTGSAALLALSVAALSVLSFSSLSMGLEPLGTALVFLAGLGCSVIYPVAMYLLGAAFPRAQAQVVATAVASGGLGLLAFPFLMSWISQTWGIRAGFVSYAALASITLLACAALGFFSSRSRESPSSANS